MPRPRRPSYRLFSSRLFAAFVLCLCAVISPAQTPPPPQATPSPTNTVTPNATPTPQTFSADVLAFVESLVAATDDEGRQSLIAARPEMLNVELRQALHARADREREAGRETLSFPLYQLAKSIAERINDVAGLALALEEIGLDYFERDEYDLAMRAFEEDLRLQRELQNTRKIAGTLNQIGMTYRARGEYAQAVESYRRSREVNEPLGDKKVLIQTLMNMGIALRYQGEYAEAINSYQHALRVQQELGDKDALVRILNGIGNVYYDQGDYAQAIENFSRSLRAAEELNNARLVSTIYNNLGESHARLGDYDIALDLHRRSLAIAETLKDRRQIASVRDSMGVLEQLRGNPAGALDLFRRSLQLREELKDKSGIAIESERVALMLHELGDEAGALKVAGQSAALAGEIGKRETLWKARVDMGRAERALGHPDAARRAFDEAIRTIEELRADVAGGEEARERYFADKVTPYYEVAGMLADAGQPDEAFAYAEQGKGRALLDVLRNGRARLDDDLTSDERTREARLKGDLTSLGVLLRREGAQAAPRTARLADLNAQLGAARLAHADFRTSLYARHPELRVRRGEAETIRRAGVGELVPDAQTAIIEYVVTENVTYLFVFTKADAGGQPALVIHTVQIKRGEVARRVESFRAQLARADLTFAPAARALYDDFMKPAEVELKGKRRLVIVPDEALWELPFQALRAADGQYLIERCAVSYAPSLTVLREMTRARKRLAGEPPVQQKMLLAFGNPSLTNAAHAPARIAAGAAQAPAALQSVSPAVLAALPEAERQVRALSRLYGPAQSLVRVGAEAREGRLKSEAHTYRILHFATHGTLNDASPMYSHIMLASESGATGETTGGGALTGAGARTATAGEGEPREDGVLEAWEMMGLNLRASMVVLSACETARGRVSAGEGVIGMSWALFVAGSPTTVVSQWKVESASTTGMMVAFYSELTGKSVDAPRRGGRSGSVNNDAPRAPVAKAEALRRAALKLLADERYAHPFYWAGFVMIGDGD